MNLFLNETDWTVKEEETEKELLHEPTYPFFTGRGKKREETRQEETKEEWEWTNGTTAQSPYGFIASLNHLFIL